METNSQLIKKIKEGGYNNVYPIAYIDGIIDKESNEKLSDILIRYNNIMVPWQGDVASTRNRVPSLMRRQGIVITYITDLSEIVTEVYKGTVEDIKNNWTDNINWELVPDLKFVQDNASKLPDGTITPEKLSPALQELISQSGSVVNMPDDEDLEQKDMVLKFKDRPYNPELASSNGYKILRKNWTNVGTKTINLLTQDVLNQSNTIYEIRYDFDLNGEEITVPKDCILDFKGGSFSNGTIVGNGTSIKANNTVIFNSIKIQGLWNVTNIYSSWFRDIYSNNVLKELFNLSNADILNNIYINNGEYTVSAIESDNNILKVKSNTNLYIEGHIILEPNNLDSCSIISIIKAENVFIVGSGTITGDKDSHLGATGEGGDGINISGGKGIVVSGLTIHNCWGDCVYIGGWSGINENITIKDFHLYNGRRQGISITWGNNITIKDGKINDISGTEPYSCIDLEPNTGCVVSNINIDNVKMNSTKGVLIIPGQDIYNTPDTNTRDIKISNCEIEGDILLYISTSYNIKIENTRFISTTETDYAIYFGGVAINQPYLFEKCYFNIPNKTLFYEQGSYIKMIDCIITANNLNTVSYQNKILNEFIKCKITLGEGMTAGYTLCEDCHIYTGSRLCTGDGYVFKNNIITKKDEGLAFDTWIFLQGDCILDGNEFIINGSITNRAVINVHSGINTIINNIATVMYPDDWNSNSSFIDGTLTGCKISNNKVSDDTKKVFNLAITDPTKALLGPEYEYKVGSTDNRPTTNLLSGQSYFDTTIKKPIWWNGTAWIDATGTNV